MTDAGPLQSVDLADAATVFEPPGDGEGHWVGAPCAHRHDGAIYLAVRWRDPDRRGYAVAVYERTGPNAFAERARVTADDLGVRSVERPALVTDPDSGALRCYVPVDHGENDWTIQALDAVPAPAALDPDTARDVLVPQQGTSDEVTVKDPCVVVHEGRYYMFYAGHDGVSEQAHLATSDDGLAWERSPANPVLERGGWHDHHTRVACVVAAPDASSVPDASSEPDASSVPDASSEPDAPRWRCYYGGSGTDDYGATWNLRTGVALARDLADPTDCTPDAPALTAPAVDSRTGLRTFGTARYVDVLDRGDRSELFAEVARPDGAFELVRAELPGTE